MIKIKDILRKIVINIKITKFVKRYRHYVFDDGKYHISKYHNQYVRYGNNIKNVAIDLVVNLSNSTDGIVQFMNDISNKGIILSKGTLINWGNE